MAFEAMAAAIASAVNNPGSPLTLTAPSRAMAGAVRLRAEDAFTVTVGAVNSTDPLPVMDTEPVTLAVRSPATTAVTSPTASITIEVPAGLEMVKMGVSPPSWIGFEVAFKAGMAAPSTEAVIRNPEG